MAQILGFKTKETELKVKSMSVIKQKETYFKLRSPLT